MRVDQLLRAALLVVGAYLVLMLGSGLVIQFAVSGSASETIRAQLEENILVPISLGAGDFDLWQWLLLRPAISLADISIGNPGGFIAPNIFEADAVAAQVSLLSLFGERVDVRSIRISRPVIHVEKDRRGRTNLQVLAEQLAQAAKAAPTEESSAEATQGRSLAIDGFYIDAGEVRYHDPAWGEEPVSLENIQLRLFDFATDSTCRLLLEASLFGGRRSGIQFEGRGGPFRATRAPAAGELSLDLAPSEIPAGLREAYFGKLLREAPSGSRVAFTTQMEGDLMGDFSGDGRIAFTDFSVGDDADNQLPLNGEVPLNLSAKRLITNPAFTVTVPGGEISLGSGIWKGPAAMSYADGGVRGRLGGSISGVEIDELVSALTTAHEKISGTLAMPQFELRFSGRDADALRNSLQGTARLTLEDGNIRLFNMLATLEKHANKLLGGEESEEGETEFTRLQSDLEIRDQQLFVKGLIIESAAARIRGQGTITFEKVLRFDLRTTVEGGLAAALGARPDADGKQQATIPVKVRGTVDSPKVYPDIKSIVKDKAKRFLDSFLNPEPSPETEPQ